MILTGKRRLPDVNRLVNTLIMMSFLSKAVRSFGTDPVWSFLFGLAIIVALIGPFGTFDALNLPLRLLYWAPVVLGANVFVRLSNRLVNRFAANPTPLQWQVLTIVVFSMTFSPAVWSYSALFSDQLRGLNSLFVIFFNVFCVTAAIGFLVFFMTRTSAERVEETTIRPRLFNRLPDGTDAAIVRLTVDDHYVQVHMDDGHVHRILMRFADAVNEMDDTLGFCTHRSHWVAAGFVTQSLRENNREFLMLGDGAKVPVSKTYRENVAAAGFL